MIKTDPVAGQLAAAAATTAAAGKHR